MALRKSHTSLRCIACVTASRRLCVCSFWLIWCRWFRKVCSVIPSLRAISVEFLPTENDCRIPLSCSVSGETGAGRPSTSGILANCRDTLVILRSSSSFLFCSVMSCANCTIKRRRCREFSHTSVDTLTHIRRPERVFTSRSKFGMSRCLAAQSRMLAIITTHLCA